MFNLTCDESSGVDVGGLWTGPDQFELHFRLNDDDAEDVNIHILLTGNELEQLTSYLQMHLIRKAQ